MGKYNFDEVINRYNTNSLKWDYAKYRNKPEDVLPLWVADMDFKTAPEIIDEIVKKANHGIFGYSEPLESYFIVLKEWIKKHHYWEPKNNNFIPVPGVVYGIAATINAITKEGDSIIINQPVYYPFEEVILDNKRKLIVSELKYNNYKYEIDFDDFEKKIIENNVKVYILCNPHNPVGRVWKLEELQKIYEITKKHNVFVISDEIHADFIYPEYKFISYASLAKDRINNTVILTSPSKTFNLAGLQLGNIYAYDDSLKRKIKKEIFKTGYSQPNIMGLISCEAAYKYGETWYNELLIYLKSNLDFVESYLNKYINKIKLIKPEGTYLIWLDCNDLNITDRELNEIILNEAKLWLDAGNIFGKSGYGFERINIACPRSILEKALNQLKEALEKRNLI